MSSGLNSDWSSLIEEALTVEGSLGNTYNRFYNYSLGNMLLMRMQGLREPVATYKRWKELGRHVIKGSKAKAIVRPITVKKQEIDGEVKTFTRFKLVNCIFGVSETEGEPLPDYEPREWFRDRALGALAIQQTAFEQTDGNMQGYSFGNYVTVSPVARYPFKTLIHEVAHITHGHTGPGGHSDYRQHRGIREFEAEGSAFLVMNELADPEQWDRAESRAYIQNWLNGERPPEQSIKNVFKVAEVILRAGREPVEAPSLDVPFPNLVIPPALPQGGEA